ncbi:MAG: tetratricopeptide repeat protein [Myxococcales bacterium]|nr:tetratricopeptide repeat protein [Myxococcales bacterium]
MSRQASALSGVLGAGRWAGVGVALMCAAVVGCRKPGEAKLREGNAAAKAGRLEEAQRAYAQAVKQLPFEARPRVLLGNALFELGRHEEARAAWTGAVERDAASVEARLGLARLALEANDAGAALEQLTGPADGVDPALLAQRETLRGLALLARGASGDAEAALTAAQDALSSAPDGPLALYVRGGALLVLGRYSDAQAALEQLQLKHPTSPLGPYGLARLAAAQGRATDVLLQLQAAKAAAGPAWKADRVAADPAFVFLSTSEGFLALVGK